MLVENKMLTNVMRININETVFIFLGRSIMSPLYGAYVPPFGIRRPTGPFVKKSDKNLRK